MRLWDARQPRAAALLPDHNGRCVLSLAWLPWGGAPPSPAPRAALPQPAPRAPVFVPRSLMELDALLEPHEAGRDEAWRDEAPRAHASEGRRLGEALLVSGDLDGALRFFDLRSMRCQGDPLTADGAAHALHAAHDLVFAAAASGGVDGFDARPGFQELTLSLSLT